MEEPKLLTDITLVIYPSNHCFVQGPKILLVGKGEEWKEELVDTANNFWTETPVNFFYLEGEYDSDKISWLYQNKLHCDFVIGHLSNTEEIIDLTFIGPYVREKTTFLMYGDNMESVRNIYNLLNPNSNIDNPKEIILSIKQAWNWQLANSK